jgi:hypothetical protein
LNLFLKGRNFRSDAFIPQNDKVSHRLTELEVDSLRKKRVRQTIAKKALLEIAIYGCFIWVQFIVAFSNTDTNAFLYRNHLHKLFIDKDQAYTVVRSLDISCFIFEKRQIILWIEWKNLLMNRFSRKAICGTGCATFL